MPSKPFTAWATAIAKPDLSRFSTWSAWLSRRQARESLEHLRHAVALPTGRTRSALTRRIIFFNAVALIFLIGGVLVVETNRTGLVDERLASITQQSRIIASTLAEYAANEDRYTINTSLAEPLLRQLVAPTQLRARVYGTDGQLTIDTRNLLARNVVQVSELPALDFWSRVSGLWHRFYDGIMGVRPFAHLAPYFEAGSDGRVYTEVNAALNGETATAERVDEHNRLVLSVAVPVQRFKAIYGVLMVSTEGGDIDDILRSERETLLEVFLVALFVMVISSLYLSGVIAEPIRRLAAAADRVRSGHSGRESIPTMPERHDEIGDLSASLSAMTKGLYDRIDAIESFAADVAHELKNPLTSLKSAIEMLERTPDASARERLMQIVRNDVRRIDRLITDISDASRLDAELSRETSNPVDLKHLLETVAEVYRMLELPRGITLSLDLATPDPMIVIGRDERVGQIVRNLIDNAVSFSPDNGTVTIRAAIVDRTAQIFVEDEGPGIATENVERIFRRFYTERPNEHGFGKNSGLGLSIARQIAEGMNGHIWAENRSDRRGARFIVELPLARTT
ncbi:MAG TPA: stimulus-sensing domain-containing protein [Rhizomicrobium sp.]|nr:stimulus-sensing domain-containing protein [Rhizomicrobium sp.]